MFPSVSNGTKKILRSFKGQNLRYLSPIILKAEFGALTQISEAKSLNYLIWKYPLVCNFRTNTVGLKRIFVERCPKDMRTAKN